MAMMGSPVGLYPSSPVWAVAASGEVVLAPSAFRTPQALLGVSLGKAKAGRLTGRRATEQGVGHVRCPLPSKIGAVGGGGAPVSDICCGEGAHSAPQNEPSNRCLQAPEGSASATPVVPPCVPPLERLGAGIQS